MFSANVNSVHINQVNVFPRSSRLRRRASSSSTLATGDLNFYSSFDNSRNHTSNQQIGDNYSTVHHNYAPPRVYVSLEETTSSQNGPIPPYHSHERAHQMAGTGASSAMGSRDGGIQQTANLQASQGGDSNSGSLGVVHIDTVNQRIHACCENCLRAVLDIPTQNALTSEYRQEPHPRQDDHLPIHRNQDTTTEADEHEAPVVVEDGDRWKRDCDTVSLSSEGCFTPLSSTHLVRENDTELNGDDPHPIIKRSSHLQSSDTRQVPMATLRSAGDLNTPARVMPQLLVGTPRRDDQGRGQMAMPTTELPAGRLQEPVPHGQHEPPQIPQEAPAPVLETELALDEMGLGAEGTATWLDPSSQYRWRSELDNVSLGGTSYYTAADMDHADYNGWDNESPSLPFFGITDLDNGRGPLTPSLSPSNMGPTGVNTIHSFGYAQNVRPDTHNQNNTNVSHVDSSSSYRTPLDRLLANIAPGAFHDADEACDLPKCHPETRAAVQENILSWIEHGDAQPKKLMWITGPAGSGKTAIASTVAEICQERGFLAASFFFSAFAYSPYRRSKRRLITTLAYQLMQHEILVGFKDAVLRRIERDPIVFQKHIKEQVEALILGPLRSLRLPRSNLPKVIIIDGLNECESDSDIRDRRPSTDVSGRGPKEKVHREILSALLQALDDPSFPFRIIVVSRPERAIKHFFELDERVASNTLGIFLDGSYRPDTDIALFLRAKFTALGLQDGIPQGWFNDEDIATLVEQASGQFIYPATIVRFIMNAQERVRQLKRIVSWQATVSESNPFATLDALYTRILQSSPDKILAVKWIQAFRLLQQESPAISSDESTLFIRLFLEDTPGQMAAILGPLSSLLSLEGTESRMSFHLYHKTLADFLADPKRCGDLYVAEAAQYEFLRGRWYEIMKARGCQVPVKDRGLQRRFLDLYAQMPRSWPMVRFVDLDQPYNSVDVQWWLGCLGSFSTHPCALHMLRFVHTQCPCYRCISSCKVWRKRILQHYKQHELPAPEKVELFLDRFVPKI